MRSTASPPRHLHLLCLVLAVIAPTRAQAQASDIMERPVKLASCPAADSAVPSPLGKIKGSFSGTYRKGLNISVLSPAFDLILRKGKGIQLLSTHLQLRGQPPYAAPTLFFQLSFGDPTPRDSAGRYLQFLLPDGSVLVIGSMDPRGRTANGNTYVVELPYAAFRQLAVASPITMMIGSDSIRLPSSVPKAFRGLFAGAMCGWTYK